MTGRPLTRMAIVGAGPGGLFLASLVRRQLPDVSVTVFERNQRADAFGFGVVFSDATLRAIDEADPVLRDALRAHGRHWDRIDVWSDGQRHSFSGNGMAAIHRRVLLQELQGAADLSGADVRFGTEAPGLVELQRDYDLVVGADGTNSSIRQQLEAQVAASGATLGHRVDTAEAKFIWFGTKHLFPGLTFVHKVSEHGNFAVHGYPISDDLSTFIVETDEATWRSAGMDAFDVTQPPGASDDATQAYLEKLFAEETGEAVLVANNSRWGNFRTRRTAHWFHGKVAMLGDAVHTAHFSVGSGTKMAMEDAVVLAEAVVETHRGQDLDAALAGYQQVRSQAVGKIHAAAIPSLSWWEHFGFYQRQLDPLTFAFHFFSRSIDIDRIARRDPALVREVRDAWHERHGAPALQSALELPSADGPLRLHRNLRLERQAAPGQVRISDTDGTGLLVPLVRAPSDEEAVDAATASLPTSGVVLIEGDNALARGRLAEEARLGRGLVAIVTGPDITDEVAETLVLSGRADAVAR